MTYLVRGTKLGTLSTELWTLSTKLWSLSTELWTLSTTALHRHLLVAARLSDLLVRRTKL